MGFDVIKKGLYALFLLHLLQLLDSIFRINYKISYMSLLNNIFTIIVLTFLLFPNNSNGQVFLEDLSLYPDSYITKKIHDNPDVNQYYPFIDGRGSYPNLNAQNNFPKKVALLSFYVWNDQIILTNKSVEEFWKGSSWIDSVRGNKLASSLISYSIESIIKRFDSLGTKIIIPSDFTVDQKAAYDSVQVIYSKSYRKNVPASISYELSAPSSYKFIKLPNQKLDADFANSLEEIARILNVDAVLFIENKTTYDGSLGIINNVYMNMYGFNPMGTNMPTNGKVNKKVTYNDFLLYGSIELEVNAIISQYNAAKELTYENYIGYDRLLNLMIDHLYTMYQTRAKILPKKS
jgi:hypothetical protein